MVWVQLPRKAQTMRGISPDAYGELDIASVITGNRENKWDPHEIDLADEPIDQDVLALLCSAIHRSSMMVAIRGVLPVNVFNYLNLMYEPDKPRNNSATPSRFWSSYLL